MSGCRLSERDLARGPRPPFACVGSRSRIRSETSSRHLSRSQRKSSRPERYLTTLGAFRQPACAATGAAALLSPSRTPNKRAMRPAVRSQAVFPLDRNMATSFLLRRGAATCRSSRNTTMRVSEAPVLGDSRDFCGVFPGLRVSYDFGDGTVDKGRRDLRNDSTCSSRTGRVTVPLPMIRSWKSRTSKRGPSASSALLRSSRIFSSPIL